MAEGIRVGTVRRLSLSVLKSQSLSLANCHGDGVFPRAVVAVAEDIPFG
jgi:hypothetical protein